MLKLKRKEGGKDSCYFKGGIEFTKIKLNVSFPVFKPSSVKCLSEITIKHEIGLIPLANYKFGLLIMLHL